MSPSSPSRRQTAGDTYSPLEPGPRALYEPELRGIVDAIPHVIVALAPDGSPIYANKWMLDYIGLTDAEIRRPGVRTRIFHPDDVTLVEAQRRAGMKRELPFETEQRARRHDGEYRWFLYRYHPFRDESGTIVRWYATGMDIDDRKRGEERTQNENVVLREDIDRISMFDDIVGSSRVLRDVLAQVTKVAKSDATVLILGETGTGKELIARAIHKKSARANRAFIRVNCASIPTALVASELFGHEKGAFTGALQRRVGRFEAADGGSIFLDEIGDLPLDTQVSLLRVLQEREIERVGSSTPISIDVRVIAATNRDLEAAIAAGTFRQDLFYRLNVVPIVNPPLRERLEDIPMLVEFLVPRFAKRIGKTLRKIEKTTLKLLQGYDWPGNVRELQNVIERAVVLCDGDAFSIEESWLRATSAPNSACDRRSQVTLADGEKELVIAALKASAGRVSGPNGAARKLGIPRQTLESKLKAMKVDATAYRAR